MTDADNEKRLAGEEAFHNEWAESTDVARIDVVHANEVCTSPEMRWIVSRLGDLRGKTLLDVGCGLGEASVYFALKGASVVATDLSVGMLDATQRLAVANDVSLRTHRSNAESLELDASERFDFIYVGNLFHHVEIEPTLKRLIPHLASGGALVSWEPLAYNPLINVYRWIATKVRTPDEHPLRVRDLRLFRRHFAEVEFEYFWFFTLVIFLLMAFVQFRNPNKVRYWKKVVEEGDRWAWLYRPLAFMDRVVLAAFPPLRLLCWNVAIVAKRATGTMPT